MRNHIRDDYVCVLHQLQIRAARTSRRKIDNKYLRIFSKLFLFGPVGDVSDRKNTWLIDKLHSWLDANLTPFVECIGTKG